MPKSSEALAERSQKVLVGLLLSVLLGIALVHGIRITHGLAWGMAIDLYRDTAWAQAFVDGRWFEDAFYAGETMSYVPLAPAVVAVLSLLTGATVHTMYAQAGTYLNLLAPIGLFVLAARWFDKWVALAAVLAFLFLFNADPYTAVGYRPWLTTALFSQIVFFPALMAYRSALTAGSWKKNVVAGIGLGLVFMAHVGPAVVIGGIVLVCEGLRARRERQWKAGLLRIGTILGAALAASAPLSVSLLGHYRLRVLNPDPAHWVWPAEAADIPSMMLANLSFPVIFTVVGIGVALRGWPRRPQASIISAWIVTSGALWLWGYVWQAAFRRGIELPSAPVPTWHFLWYLKTVEPLLFGCGLVFVCERVARRIPERIIPSRWRLGAVVSVTVIALGAAAVPGYPRLFADHRAHAEHYASVVPRTEIVAWIREHTSTEDVFLTQSTSPETGAPTLLVGPAGRKVVAPENSMFASAFVDWKARDRDRRSMLQALARGEVERFRGLAESYGVTYLLISREMAPGKGSRTVESETVIHPAFEASVTLRLERGLVRIYRVGY